MSRSLVGHTGRCSGSGGCEIARSIEVEAGSGEAVSGLGSSGRKHAGGAVGKEAAFFREVVGQLVDEELDAPPVAEARGAVEG